MEGYFGNPHRLRKGEPLGTTLRKYAKYFLWRLENDEQFRQAVDNIEPGKVLGCFCAGNVPLTRHRTWICHGQIMAEYIDTKSTDQITKYVGWN